MTNKSIDKGRQMVNLSLCMIVRDNEDTIGPCLESIAPWVDEIIVVDTGSKDKTPDICKSYGAKLFCFDWIDDFSAARNESIKHASGKWIFWMDSDDTIPQACGAELRQLACKEHCPNIMGFVMQVRCPCGDEFTVVDHVKIFSNRPDIRFEGRIHEQVLMPIRRLGGEVCHTNIYVIHSGSDQSEASRRRKTERDLRILRKDLAERPDHPFVHFNFAMTFAENEEFEEALPWIDKCLELSSHQESHVAKTFAYKANCLFQLRRYDEALVACKSGRHLHPNDTELLFREGMVLHELKQFDEAIDRYRQILLNTENHSFRSTDPGIRGHKCKFNLGIALQDAGRLDDAELQWRQVLDERPEFLPAQRAISKLLIDRKRFVAAQVAADSMEADEQSRARGMLLRAAIEEAKGDPEQAGVVYRQCLEAFPNNEEVVEEYCRFSFVRGDFTTAEQLLNHTLATNPESPAALHNLGSIDLHRGDFDSAINHLNESIRLRPDSESTVDLFASALVGRDQEYESRIDDSRTFQEDKPEINIEFTADLDEAVLLVRLLDAAIRQGYTVNVTCHPKHRFLFSAVGAGVADDEVTAFSFDRPPAFIGSRLVKPWHVNRGLWNLTTLPLPSIGKLVAVWRQLESFDCRVACAKPPERKQELAQTVGSLPKPICLLSVNPRKESNQNAGNWEDDFSKLLTSAIGGVTVLHADSRLTQIDRLNDPTILSDNIDTETLKWLIDTVDVVVSDSVETLALASISDAPSVGIWQRSDCPAEHLLPCPRQLHVVFGELQQDRNRVFRYPWNVVEQDGELDVGLLSELTERLLRETKLLPSDRMAADLQLQHWISLCREETEPVRDRDRSFDVLFREIGKRFEKPTIVETGSVRAEDDWSGAGFFTYLAGACVAQSGGKLLSVDIDPRVCKFARELCQPFGDSVEINCCDSITFLSNFNSLIDVLYLDSMDTYQPGFSEHALNELRAAFDKLHVDSIVVVDDSPTNSHGEVQGKGSFVVPWLLEREWRILFAGYQVIMVKN